MKKIICIVAVVLMIVSVVYAQKKMAIKAQDLPGMKGMWAGTINFGVFQGGGSSACTLEIFNDKVPVEAKLTISAVPQAVASGFGIQAGQNVMESNEGSLTSMGTIFFTGPEKNFLEISKTGEKKISIYYFFRGLRGDGSLSKK